ncbi:MAG: nitrate reductase molybdenum cofactor assembly chaperone [Acidimicrobiales bacterium]
MKAAAASTVFGCASVLLSYPDSDFHEDLRSVERAAASGLSRGTARSGLISAASALGGLSVMDAAARYVETFDLRRGTSLYLTYYRHGDTRERGMALAALVQVYRTAGFELVGGELPDHLPALLELAAVSSKGAAVLSEHAAAIAAVRTTLEESSSPYAGAFDAVCSALGPISKADAEFLRRYRAEGPPSERVGLEPFAPPEVVQRVSLR